MADALRGRPRDPYVLDSVRELPADEVPDALVAAAKRLDVHALPGQRRRSGAGPACAGSPWPSEPLLEVNAAPARRVYGFRQGSTRPRAERHRLMGRRRLRANLPRAFRSHAGAIGRLYRDRFEALEESMGPFVSRLERQEARRTASLGTLLDLATETLMTAQQARKSGKGRRPSVREVERLSRRQGLQDTSYAAALDRLRELCGAKPRVPDLEAYLAAKGNGKTP
jgi:hypothetical protein